MNESWESILDEATTLWHATRQSYRDFRLRMGDLLNRYLLLRLEVADTLGEARRTEEGVSRAAAVAHAAKRLGVAVSVVNGLLHVAGMVRLLAADGVGELSWAALRKLRVLVARRGGRVRRGTGKDGLAPSAREEWLVTGDEAKARAIFRQAVAEKWDSDEVASALPSGRAQTETCDYAPRTGAGPGVGRTSPGMGSLVAMVKAGTPRDTADLIRTLIRQSSDPPLVCEILGLTVRS